MGRSRVFARHLSTIEDHYKLVGEVLIGEAKSAMKNKGKITKVKITTVAYKEILGIDDTVEECSTCTRIRR